MRNLSGCPPDCRVQRFHPARTHSKQNTLLTEIEMSTKHQGEKDTGIHCSKRKCESKLWGHKGKPKTDVFDPSQKQ